MQSKSSLRFDVRYSFPSETLAEMPLYSAVSGNIESAKQFVAVVDVVDADPGLPGDIQQSFQAVQTFTGSGLCGQLPPQSRPQPSRAKRLEFDVRSYHEQVYHNDELAYRRRAHCPWMELIILKTTHLAFIQSCETSQLFPRAA